MNTSLIPAGIPVNQVILSFERRPYTFTPDDLNLAELAITGASEVNVSERDLKLAIGAAMSRQMDNEFPLGRLDNHIITTDAAQGTVNVAPHAKFG